MMKKKILFIIIFILIIFIILGSLYFISYSGKSQASQNNKNEVNTVSETILNESKTENENYNEIENEVIEDTSNIDVPEKIEEKQEVIESKQETQLQEKVNVPTQTQSSSSNNKQKTEPVKQSTTTVETPTQPTVQKDPEPTNIENSKVEEKQPEPVVERCTNNNNHGMDVGNSGRWFNSKSEAIAYYDSQTKLWGDKWENFEIDDDTYYKNCPSGYEVWTCMFCGKWTINFYYR